MPDEDLKLSNFNKKITNTCMRNMMSQTFQGFLSFPTVYYGQVFYSHLLHSFIISDKIKSRKCSFRIVDISYSINLCCILFLKYLASHCLYFSCLAYSVRNRYN